jgi:CBS domain-containing protein
MKTVQDLIRGRREIYSLPQEASLRSAAQYMHDKHVRAVPVTDQTGHLAGILSDWDLVHAVAKNLDVDRRSIAYIVTRHPITTTPEQSYSDCLTTMLRHGFHHLVVVKNENGTERILGTISLDDLLRLDEAEQGERVGPFETFLRMYEAVLDAERH